MSHSHCITIALQHLLVIDNNIILCVCVFSLDSIHTCMWIALLSISLLQRSQVWASVCRPRAVSSSCKGDQGDVFCNHWLPLPFCAAHKLTAAGLKLTLLHNLVVPISPSLPDCTQVISDLKQNLLDYRKQFRKTLGYPTLDYVTVCGVQVC